MRFIYAMDDKAIVGYFLPTFHLHSEEEHFSMHIENYVKYCQETPDGLNLAMVNPECEYGRRDELQLITSVVELIDENGAPVVDVVYYVFYPYNGSIDWFGKGAHWYDMEHITLRFMGYKSEITQDRRPAKVMFSFHSKYYWFEWNAPELKIDANGITLNVYVAQGSHACYPEPGRYWRYFGVANDVCDEGFTPQFIVIIMYDPNLKIFQYRSVCDGDSGRNWNKRELKWGQLPDYTPYGNGASTYFWT